MIALYVAQKKSGAVRMLNWLQYIKWNTDLYSNSIAAELNTDLLISFSCDLPQSERT